MEAGTGKQFRELIDQASNFRQGVQHSLFIIGWLLVQLAHVALAHKSSKLVSVFVDECNVGTTSRVPRCNTNPSFVLTVLASDLDGITAGISQAELLQMIHLNVR